MSINSINILFSKNLNVHGQEQPDASKEAKETSRQILEALKESQLMESGGQSTG